MSYRWMKRLGLAPEKGTDREYMETIEDIIAHPEVNKMWNYVHHRYTSTMMHALYVSYNSYLIAKKLGLDWRAAARGGLLHDFYLYDWHTEKPYKGMHGFAHPRIALKNAMKYFDLTDRERDIILKHMFPLTPVLPRYRESYIIMLVDKYCAVRERSAPAGRPSVLRLVDELNLMPS